MPSLQKDGFEIHRDVFDPDALRDLRDRAAHASATSGTACVRNLQTCFPNFHHLAKDGRLTALLPVGISPVRSILFDKTPEKNWPVARHQDLTIAVSHILEIEGYQNWTQKHGVSHVQPPVALLKGMTTIRIHLDETGSENGALRVIPGSHQRGKIPCDELARIDSSSAITCECSPGAVLLMSPLILHASNRSRTPSRRRIIHIEYARLGDLDSRLHWHLSEKADEYKSGPIL